MDNITTGAVMSMSFAYSTLGAFAREIQTSVWERRLNWDSNIVVSGCVIMIRRSSHSKPDHDQSAKADGERVRDIQATVHRNDLRVETPAGQRPRDGSKDLEEGAIDLR